MLLLRRVSGMKIQHFAIAVLRHAHGVLALNGKRTQSV
jgi:hypothetical protein